MSYQSRVYRQRNAHTHDEGKQESFFGKSHDINPVQKKDGFFQPKLTVNQPGDVYEKEADAVASAVVNNNSADSVIQQKKISSIQRLSSSQEDEKLATNDARIRKDKDIQAKPEVQRMCPECEKEKKKAKAKEKEKEGLQRKAGPEQEDEELLQGKSNGGATTASSVLSGRIENSAGRGRPISRKTLGEMSSSFGRDFSNVKIHTDATAVQMSRELNAQAFTHGNDIYFNSGKYNTDTSAGKQLLAHELTHVVQQGSARRIQTSPVPNVQTSCSEKSFKNCRGACTHRSGYPGTCRWTGLKNGCVCFENPRSTRSLEEILPYWIITILSAAAIAAIAACFATGVCEAGLIIGAAGAAVGAVIIGILQAAGIRVNGEETA